MSLEQIDLSVEESWKRLECERHSLLIDVRTEPEWLFVGTPDIEGLGKTLLKVSWQVYPSMERNPVFLQSLCEAGVKEEQTLLLICRSGVRSKAASLLLRENGFAKAFNVEGGFEGNLDDHKHRGLGGWKSAGLPWKQG